MSDLFQQMAADSAAAALKSAPTEEQSKAVREVGVELVTLDQRIQAGEVLLAELKERRDKLMRYDLVDAMDRIGQDKMGLAEFGVDIVTSDFVHASLPSPGPKDTPEETARKLELRRGGLDWLIENEHEGLIKTVVMVELPRGAFEDAYRIKKMIEDMPELDPETGLPRDNGPPVGYRAVVEETVHWATLTSFVREQLKRPEVVLPLEKLGAMVGRIAKIVRRKK